MQDGQDGQDGADTPGPVLVTGAAKRIGHAIAVRLAQRGRDVVVHYHTSGEAAKATAEAVRATGRSAWTVQADLEDPDAAGDLYRAASEAAGTRPTAVVNNASLFPEMDLAGMTLDDLETMVRLHAWAPHVLTRDLAMAGGGSVVHLLDTRIVDRDPHHVPYFLSKRMLYDLLRLQARRFAPHTRVNGVAPGPILPPPGEDASVMEPLAKAVPMQQVGRPEWVADAVAWLLDAPYTTGQVLFVDGGRHLGPPDAPRL